MSDLLVRVGDALIRAVGRKPAVTRPFAQIVGGVNNP
jgi:hypothetical protein